MPKKSKKKSIKKQREETNIQKIVNHYFETKGLSLEEIKKDAKKKKIIYLIAPLSHFTIIGIWMDSNQRFNFEECFLINAFNISEIVNRIKKADISNIIMNIFRLLFGNR